MTNLAIEHPKKEPASRMPRQITLEKFYQWKPEDGYKYAPLFQLFPTLK